MPAYQRLLAVLLPAALGATALAQEPIPADREWIGGAPLWRWTRLTGDWGGLRTDLEDHGVEVAGGYTSDLVRSWSGGAQKRTAYISLIDVNIAFDLEVLLGLPRTRAYVDAYALHGTNPSNFLGDFQGVSNIGANDLEQIAEAWLETWFAEQFRVKVGKVDFNSEFAFNEYGGEFVHSTAAITPAIVAYPTYPNPAMSVNVFFVPTETFYWGFGIYDGANAAGIQTGKLGPGGFFEDEESDAYLLATEAGLGWAGGETWGAGRVALGLWYHTADFTAFDGSNESGTAGLWLTAEQKLWRENPADAEDQQGLGIVLGFAYADDAVSAVGRTQSAALAWRGAVEGRDHDVLGLGVFAADLSDDPNAGTPKNEIAWELFYKVQLTPAISVKPDLQYVQNPGGSPGVDDALVALLRFDLVF